MKPLATALLIVLVMAVSAAGAHAEDLPPIGVRAGYTSWNGLDQIHLGGHAKLGDVLPNVAFTPGFELGLGSSATVLTLNSDLAYRFTEFFIAPWGLYGGGSLSFNIADVDGNSESDLGLSALVGGTYALDDGHEVMVEMRFSVIDSPDFKLTFGYTFF